MRDGAVNSIPTGRQQKENSESANGKGMGGSTSHRGVEEMVDRRSRQGQATHSPMLRGLAIQSSRRGSNASAHRLLSRRQLIKTLRDDTARAGPPSSRRPQTPAPSPGVRLSHDPLPSFLSPHPVRAH
ncbi:hypothetical protein C0Q70_18988 [Pomacea canaliculata]|uniref:Uncharacterized protein n=1 Tax=Pomacea canaliculata TaxID=400727 RepID=A0A2T7NI16_POMCA|nr:hypothetical protein C0Q70_18988 [Pomacea canaliculata]